MGPGATRSFSCCKPNLAVPYCLLSRNEAVLECQVWPDNMAIRWMVTGPRIMLCRASAKMLRVTPKRRVDSRPEKAG